MEYRWKKDANFKTADIEIIKELLKQKKDEQQGLRIETKTVRIRGTAPLIVSKWNIREPKKYITRDYFCFHQKGEGK